MDIRSVRGRHSGECVIIANGPSLTKKPLIDVEKERGRSLKYPLTETDPDLLTYPLKDIPVPVITVNQAWKLVEPTYHVVAEQVHYHRDPEVYDRLHNEGKLFTLGGDWTSGLWPSPGFNMKIKGVRPNLPPEEFQEAIWSNDLHNDGCVICFGVSGTVSYSALQVAWWLGFTTITFLGLDLYGLKFTGQAAGKLDRQREQFRAILPRLESLGLNVRVIGSDSRAPFQKVDWPFQQSLK